MFRIIDEKGRLFGKINIVDFLIVAIVLILIPAFFRVYKIMGKTPTMVPHKWVRVEAVTFTISEIAELFKPGDVTYDEFYNPNGRLLRVIGTNDKYRGIFNLLYKGPSYESSQPYVIPVSLELELKCTRSAPNENWYFRRSPLRVSFNFPITFLSDLYQIECYVTRIKD